MKIQPIITTDVSDKGNTYIKSNAGKYAAAAQLSAIGVTTALVALAKKKANPKTVAEKAEKSVPFFKTAKENIKEFFKHPIKSIKESAKKINLKSIKKEGSHIVEKAKTLSPAKKAVALSAVLTLVANLGFDFGFNKVSAHKADKNA